MTKMEFFHCIYFSPIWVDVCLFNGYNCFASRLCNVYQYFLLFTETFLYSCMLFVLVAAAAASTGVEVLSSAAGSTTSVSGLITAIILCALNVTILGGLFVWWIKTRRKRSAAEASTVSGLKNSAFRTEAGTSRSFNSLVSKFSAPSLGKGDDSISTNSSISSLS